MQHIFNKNIANTATVNYKRPVTSGEIQDKLRNNLTEYSESNPEPPSMKD
ncbi:hypothetical protein SAMN04488500_114116 [Sporomusa malonica]|uniref:Uncharacterized protein n=2 Tax=Sporomusa malonica TaxID=112901 RepID=A0A1W2DAG0_9FIRM|nr:hypothetical protein SAMN04488500_114116 [Sporomusa malonica]